MILLRAMPSPSILAADLHVHGSNEIKRKANGGSAVGVDVEGCGSRSDSSSGNGSGSTGERVQGAASLLSAVGGKGTSLATPSSLLSQIISGQFNLVQFRAKLNFFATISTATACYHPHIPNTRLLII